MSAHLRELIREIEKASETPSSQKMDQAGKGIQRVREDARWGQRQDGGGGFVMVETGIMPQCAQTR